MRIIISGINHAIFFSILLISQVLAQGRIPIDSTYQLIKSNTVFQYTTSWEAIDQQFYDCIKKTKGEQDIVSCFIKVFEYSNDFQSTLVYKNKEYSFSPKEDGAVRSDKILSEEAPLIIQTQLLNENYIYLLISGNNRLFDNNHTAQAIADSLNQYQNKVIKGIILDLRLAHAGHFPSMLSGLHSMLGSGTLGYDIDRNGKKSKEWKLVNGNFTDNHCQITTLNNKSDHFVKTPAVVLIGSETKNGGSLTAISFKYRPNTTLIGEITTHGYIGSTVFHRITKDCSLHLTEALAADRKGRIYPRFVNPDISMSGQDNFAEPQKDKKVNAALRLLQKYK